MGFTKFFHRWQGKLAALIDYTNPKASKWYFDRLKDFSSFGFESFKFDGGESNWMPIIRQFHEQSVSPDYYGRRFAEEANAHFGKGLEVRVGLHTQHVPVFVRMLDKDSVVGYDNGLRSLIPTALTFGLLGYPFILPDMIGGNAYRNGSTVPGTDGLLGKSVWDGSYILLSLNLYKTILTYARQIGTSFRQHLLWTITVHNLHKTKL